MGSIHEEIYTRVKALFDQDLDATRGLNKSTSAAYCRGGIWRIGDPKIGRTINWPHIEVFIAVDEDLNSPDGTCCICTVEFRIIGNRDQKFEGNAGDIALNTVAQRIREVYNDCPTQKPDSTFTYRISSFRRNSGAPGPVSDKEFVLTERYTVLVTSADVSVFHVYNSGQKTFFRGGFSSEVRRFIALDVGDFERPNNSLPHVGSVENLQVVQNVTRTRVFNRLDAEYTVSYKPFDALFNEVQKRVDLTMGYIDQEVPLWRRVASSTPQGNVVAYIPQYDSFRRATFARTEQIQKDIGKSADGTDMLIGIQNLIAADSNKIRIIDGKKYLFVSSELEYNTNTGIALITARFWTTGPVKARPAQSGQGTVWDVGLPALDYLEDYIVTPAYQIANDPNRTTIPQVNVRNYADLADVGDFSWLN